MNNIIEVQNLTKSFDKQAAAVLHNISFEVAAGDVFGIVGENGAGKSTLLKIMSGIIAPTSGKVIHHQAFSSILDIGSGFLPELNAKENIFLNGRMLGLTNNEINESFEQIVVFSQLQEHLKKPIKTFSSGMYLRLAFSAAVFFQNATILIDEIISVGDEVFKRKSFNKIKELAEEGRCIVLASHDLASVNGLCNKIIYLENGRIKHQDVAAKVTRRYIEDKIFKKALTKVNNFEDVNAGEHFKPKIFKILNKEDDLTTSSELNFYFEFEIKNEKKFIFSFLLKNQFNSPVLPVSLPLAKSIKERKETITKGRYEYNFTIPQFFLNSGLYSFDLIIDEEGKIGIPLENIFNFKVERSMEHEGLIKNGDKFEGPILTQIEMQLKKDDSNDLVNHSVTQ